MSCNFALLPIMDSLFRLRSSRFFPNVEPSERPTPIAHWWIEGGGIGRADAKARERLRQRLFRSRIQQRVAEIGLRRSGRDLESVTHIDCKRDRRAGRQVVELVGPGRVSVGKAALAVELAAVIIDQKAVLDLRSGRKRGRSEEHT